MVIWYYCYSFCGYSFCGYSFCGPYNYNLIFKIMQRQLDPPVLFFSHKCPACAQLIEIIKTSVPLSKGMRPVNIHEVDRAKLPPQLKNLPAVLFDGRFFQGPDAFKWVQMRISIANNQSQTGGQMPGQRGPGQGQGQGQGQGPGDFVPMEMTDGLNFTMFDGSGQGGSQGNYTFINGNNQDGTSGIDYVAAMDQSSMRTNKSDGLSQEFERLQQMRGEGNSNSGDFGMNNAMGRGIQMGQQMGGMNQMGGMGGMGQQMGGMGQQMGGMGQQMGGMGQQMGGMNQMGGMGGMNQMGGMGGMGQMSQMNHQMGMNYT
jgi:hypothetical protein